MMGSVLPETCRDLLQVKYILNSCIKLVFLFNIIWCTETQNWNLQDRKCRMERKHGRWRREKNRLYWFFKEKYL